MATKINISIPQPCHENWQEMAVIDKNRFCASCQKSVFDFSTASDRQIMEAFNKNKNLCGRFTTSQLNRDLIVPKEKSSIWLAASASFVSFIGLGTNEIMAQEPVKTEQTDRKVNTKDSTSNPNQEIEITGVVTDDFGPLPGANVVIRGTAIRTETDFDGNFKIKAKIGDVLIFSFIGYESEEKNIVNKEKLSMQLKMIPNFEFEEIIVGGIYKKRSFFSRTFHSIGNWFK